LKAIARPRGAGAIRAMREGELGLRLITWAELAAREHRASSVMPIKILGRASVPAPMADHKPDVVDDGWVGSLAIIGLDSGGPERAA
jgi:hypothetical protein